jgi:hypothetical protein
MMQGKEERCPFLNPEGRCAVHPFRPGMCRIFPLGRYYENRSFQYFLQVHECRNQKKTKIKVKKWIDAENLSKQEPYIADWHYFLKDVQEIIQSRDNENLTNDLRMYVFQLFFVKAYRAEQDFYEQFYQRLEEAGKVVF